MGEDHASIPVQIGLQNIQLLVLSSFTSLIFTLTTGKVLILAPLRASSGLFVETTDLAVAPSRMGSSPILKFPIEGTSLFYPISFEDAVSFALWHAHTTLSDT